MSHYRLFFPLNISYMISFTLTDTDGHLSTLNGAYEELARTRTLYKVGNICML
jgi:hypothetical protein